MLVLLRTEGYAMTLPKVLLGIVVYDGKQYIWDKFWANVRNLSYPNLDIVVVDNSRTKKFYSKLKRDNKHVKNARFYHVNRGFTSREAQAKSLNKIRSILLDEGYDYFMSIESDLIPPRDVIERLMSHNVDVIGSMYLIGYEDSKTQVPRPCLFGVEVKPNGTVGTFNFPPEKGFAFFGNGLVPIHGCGIGCSLISRKIMERFRWWYDLNEPVKHSDVLFYMDLHNQGIQVYLDSNMIIPHYNSKWDDVIDK